MEKLAEVGDVVLCTVSRGGMGLDGQNLLYPASVNGVSHDGVTLSWPCDGPMMGVNAWVPHGGYIVQPDNEYVVDEKIFKDNIAHWYQMSKDRPVSVVYDDGRRMCRFGLMRPMEVDI